jgi:hypothetical protein
VVVAFIAIWLSERLVRRSRAQFPEAS